MLPEPELQPANSRHRASQKASPRALFNRKFLLLLVLILPLVILLLNQAPQPRDPLAQLRFEDEQYFLPRAQSAYTLHLLLPTRANLSDRAWIEQQLEVARLRQGITTTAIAGAAPSSNRLPEWLLQQQWQPGELSPEPGYLRLTFNLPAPPTGVQRQQLLQGLQQLPPAPPTLHQRLQAQRYLEGQTAEQQLLSALGDRLGQQPQTPDRTPRWTLVGPTFEQPTATAAHTAISAPAPTAAPAPDFPGGELQLRGSRGQGWQLLASPLPAPADAAQWAQQRMLAELVSQLLAQVTQGKVKDYRWLWQPLPDAGYQALLLRQPDPTLLNELSAQLAARLDQTLLDQTRQTLLQRLDDLLQNNPQQWLDLLALYRLPLDSHLVFRATLEQLDLPSCQNLLAQTLNADHRLSLSFASTGTPSP